MRRTPIIAAALALSLTGAGTASAATNGTGSVTDTVVGTVVPGLLTIAGAGANVAISGTPGEWTEAIGATVVTVSDLTGGSAGWAVTATYAAPATGSSIGGDNVKVSATGVTSDLTGVNLSPAVDAALGSPVTVATTGTAAGTGVTAFTAKYKVKLPTTAAVGDVFSGTVTYTVATVR